MLHLGFLFGLLISSTDVGVICCYFQGSNRLQKVELAVSLGGSKVSLSCQTRSQTLLQEYRKTITTQPVS